MKTNIKITSAGIIRNPEKPRVGVTSLGSLSEWIYDTIDGGIDLTFEHAEEETREQITAENPGMDDDEIDELVSESLSMADFDGRVILFGDWKKDKDGRYTPDTSGEYSAKYNGYNNLVTVEWSRHTVACHHTSPCFVMADGSGPCGDLDTPGDSVIAYTLPPEFFREEGE